MLCVLHALCRYCVAGEIQRDVPACERVAACEIHICAEYDARYAPVRHQRVQRVVRRDVRARIRRSSAHPPFRCGTKASGRGGHAAGASTVPPFGPAVLLGSQRYSQLPSPGTRRPSTWATSPACSVAAGQLPAGAPRSPPYGSLWFSLFLCHWPLKKAGGCFPLGKPPGRVRTKLIGWLRSSGPEPLP